MPDFARAHAFATDLAADNVDDDLAVLAAAYLSLDKALQHQTRHDTDELEVHRTKRRNGELSFYWRRRSAGNHEKVASGQGYTRLDDAITGALRANPDLSDANLTVLGAR